MSAQVVLAIDPGRAKCGLAVVSPQGTLAREICSPDDLVERVHALIARTGASRVLMGGGTNGRKLARAIKAHEDIPTPEIVNEEFSTLEARKRFFRENPPGGVRRLIPRSMLIPGEPIDDLVAVILAERAIAADNEV